MAHIIAVAENFAYGPVGKLLTVTRRLQDQGHVVTFIGAGTAYQLGRREPFQRIIYLDTDSPEFALRGPAILQEGDVLLSCMDRASVLMAKRLGVPVIWLDTLFWWWDEVPDFLFDVSCYIAQSSLKDDRNRSRYAHRIERFHAVGPIIDAPAVSTTERKQQLLVCFGGMEAAGWYSVGADSQYPYVLTDLILNDVSLDHFDTILFTGNERILHDLAQRHGHQSATFRQCIFETLQHSVFVRELARSEFVFQVPGLETPLEAFACHVPSVFLPPSNSSQYVQLDEFVSAGAANMAVHFRDFYPPLDLLGRDLRWAMTEFLSQLHRFESDRAAQLRTAEMLNRFLGNRDLHARQVEGQDAYMASLGNIGTDRAVALVNQTIERLGSGN